MRLKFPHPDADYRFGMIGAAGSSYTSAIPDLTAAAATGSSSAIGLLKKFESIQSETTATLLSSLPGPTYSPAGGSPNPPAAGQLLNVQA